MCGDRSGGKRDPREADLIVAAQQGDRRAYDELVRMHQRDVLRWAYGIIRSRDLADEVAQEVFVRTYEALDRIDPTRPLASWLCRSAMNLSFNILRKQKSAARFIENAGSYIAEIPSGADKPDAIFRRRRAVEIVNKVMDELPEKYRAVLMLRADNEYSYQQIAHILGISLGTVMSRLARARQRMRKALGNILEDL